jgi:hypothetical protein
MLTCADGLNLRKFIVVMDARLVLTQNQRILAFSLREEQSFAFFPLQFHLPRTMAAKKLQWNKVKDVFYFLFASCNLQP